MKTQKLQILKELNMTKYVKNANELYDIPDEVEIKEDILSFDLDDGITADNIFINFDQNANATDIEKQLNNDINIDISRPYYERRELPNNQSEYIYTNNEATNIKKTLIQNYTMYFKIDIWNYTKRLSSNDFKKIEDYNKNIQYEKNKEFFCKIIKEKLKNKLLLNGYLIDLEDENNTELDNTTNLKQNHFILELRKNVAVIITELFDLVEINKYPSIENIFFNT